MIIEKLKTQKYISDHEFNSIYPIEIQTLSSRHWTPVDVAKKAAQFLCYKDGLKVLDAGSGAGKFCMVGATIQPFCTFFGIDFRDQLIGLSNQLKEKYKINNVEYIKKNLLDVNFTDFDSIYFFNSFHERIDDSAIIDNKSKVSHTLYRRYMKNLYLQLSKMPIGTRVASYHTSDFCIPNSYSKVRTLLDGYLKFFIKVKENDLTTSRINEDINQYLVLNYPLC